jgi:hypothetical protein
VVILTYSVWGGPYKISVDVDVTVWFTVAVEVFETVTGDAVTVVVTGEF